MSVEIRECVERKTSNFHNNYREIEFDILRITAMFAVILVHAFGTDGLDIGEWKWKELTFIRSLVTWEVPIFVMISGRFFFDPESDCRTWKKSEKSLENQAEKRK